MFKEKLINQLNITFEFLKDNLELIFWLTGLIYLISINPTNDHFTFCPLNQIGTDWCPGCGLGKSLSFIFHFDLSQSIKTHPLGIFALIIIIHRILTLTKNFRRELYDKHLQLSSRN